MLAIAVLNDLRKMRFAIFQFQVPPIHDFVTAARLRFAHAIDLDR